MKKSLPLPPWFDPNNATRFGYAPNETKLCEESHAWAKQHAIRPAASDAKTTHLLLIDVQKDFCFPEGALYVGGRDGKGAVEDTRRIAEHIYRNMVEITQITTTMDTHFSHQIFFPAFWVDEHGAMPSAHREVTSDDVASGKLRPNPAIAKQLCNGNYAWLVAQAKDYCEQLEKAGKYKLYLWPPHCLMGGSGHALAGLVHEARLVQAFARTAQSTVEVKGGHPLTENYSVLRPEVLIRHDAAPLAQRNTAFLKTLLSSDRVVIAGQAASHCVKSTIDDLLDEIVAYDRALVRKIFLLTDCMSAVTVPDGKGGFHADFTPLAEAALQRFADAGMHLVRSTDPIHAWPV
jgi:nicotinamidase-related amidase